MGANLQRSRLVAIDLPAMVITALVCIPVFLTGRRVSRSEDIVFLIGYAGFLTHLLVTRL